MREQNHQSPHINRRGSPHAYEGANLRELCRRFGIHPDTGYKWLKRWRAGEVLAERSRRPHESPSRTV
ncbi:MAG TPA: helix-turn-helix domain-containing protein, partial [Reyranella sp.]|nr:helix-turn-helix domain-containing protein [Reyranella sp.]